MKLKQINFNKILAPGLSIFVDGKEIAWGTTWEVLKKIPVECAEYEIEKTNYLFNVYVIRLKSGKEKANETLD